jgi:AbiU2
MTSEEMEQRNVAAMGAELGKQYTVLFQEFATLNLYWKEFIELFGSSEKRVERLNRAAPGFFRMVQDQQFETNMLHLARLTDSPKSVGRENLTIRNLPALVGDSALKQELLALLDQVERKTQFCRDWRNRHFAHRDLMLSTQHTSATPLEAVTKEKFFAALRAVSDVLNAMERFYYRGGCSFEDIAAHNGAGTLLHILGLGIEARERMREQIAKGDFSAFLPQQV